MGVLFTKKIRDLLPGETTVRQHPEFTVDQNWTRRIADLFREISFPEGTVIAAIDISIFADVVIPPPSFIGQKTIPVTVTKKKTAKKRK